VPPVVTQEFVEAVARISAWQKISSYFGRICQRGAGPSVTAPLAAALGVPSVYNGQ
jgi:hypothetical protein